MAPIRKGDGTAIKPQSINQVRAGDGRVFYDIPKTLISRPADNYTSLSGNHARGVRIETNSAINGLKATISQNNTGPTEAVLSDTSGTVLKTTDISALGVGDEFSLTYSMGAGNSYYFYLTTGGTDWTYGAYDSAQYPYTGNQFDITAGVYSANNQQIESNSTFYCMNDIKNLDY